MAMTVRATSITVFTEQIDRECTKPADSKPAKRSKRRIDQRDRKSGRAAGEEPVSKTGKFR